MTGYTALVGEIGAMMEQARRSSVRAVNAVMTATYWSVGRRLVKFEQSGAVRAGYGEGLLKRLSEDLTERFGKGFSVPNLENMRLFYRLCGEVEKSQTVSGKLAGLRAGGRGTRKSQTLSRIFRQPARNELTELARRFPLPWSHYVLLIRRAGSPEAFGFYHAEALRGGWSVRQLLRQMDSQFYERTALSRNKSALLQQGALARPDEITSAVDEIRHPLVLEFLGLRDEYSESDLEEALIRHLEAFMLELGNDFAFVGRQRRLRIGEIWYRIDLLMFHRRLRCLVIIDLKLGHFSHTDVGQMNLYLNYAKEHWVQPGENPPVGIVLCSGKSDALVHYATESLPNKMLVREYRTALPAEAVLSTELERTRRRLELHADTGATRPLKRRGKSGARCDKPAGGRAKGRSPSGETR